MYCEPRAIRYVTTLGIIHILYSPDEFFARFGETTPEHTKSLKINIWLPFPLTIEILVICYTEMFLRRIGRIPRPKPFGFA